MNTKLTYLLFCLFFFSLNLMAQDDNQQWAIEVSRSKNSTTLRDSKTKKISSAADGLTVYYSPKRNDFYFKTGIQQNYISTSDKANQSLRLFLDSEELPFTIGDDDADEKITSSQVNLKYISIPLGIHKQFYNNRKATAYTEFELTNYFRQNEAMSVKISETGYEKEFTISEIRQSIQRSGNYHSPIYFIDARLGFGCYFRLDPYFSFGGGFFISRSLYVRKNQAIVNYLGYGGRISLYMYL